MAVPDEPYSDGCGLTKLTINVPDNTEQGSFQFGNCSCTLPISTPHAHKKINKCNGKLKKQSNKHKRTKINKNRTPNTVLTRKFCPLHWTGHLRIQASTGHSLLCYWLQWWQGLWTLKHTSKNITNMGSPVAHHQSCHSKQVPGIYIFSC